MRDRTAQPDWLAFTMAHASLVDGWIVEPLSESCGKRAVNLRRPVGSVTVDFDRRNYVLGVQRPPSPNGLRYRGRGWAQRLVEDAKAELIKVERERVARRAP